MSIMDMLGGAPPPGAAPMGGPPPEMGGPPPEGAPMGAPPPGLDGGGGGTPGQPDNPDSESALQGAIDAIHAFLQAEEDDSDKAVAAKCLAQLQGIFGGRQKEEESAQGITPAHKAMGRAMSKRAPAGGPPPGY